MLRGWRGRDPYCVPEQVANAPDASVDLTPVSQAPAEAVRAAWAPLLYGQPIPRIGERTFDAEPCDPL